MILHAQPDVNVLRLVVLPLVEPERLARGASRLIGEEGSHHALRRIYLKEYRSQKKGASRICGIQ